MKIKKLFILIPDGIGLRNFAFTSFVEVGKELGWEVVFWNQTSFDLSIYGCREKKLTGIPRPFTDILKRAKINSELGHFEHKFQDTVYKSYKFSSPNTTLKARIKNIIVSKLERLYRGEKGLARLRKKMKESARKSNLYRNSYITLQQEQPDFVFCTNQRAVKAIAPITAAQDLGISTGSFIFSWDNLPKATMVVEPNFYFVWSEYMKTEMLNYYPFVKDKQVFITGSPQFEPHFNNGLRKSRKDFLLGNKLDPAKKYICFSGDDVTTSPDDPTYLNDIAQAVQKLNREGNNLGIIFRRCPVDFSDRYDLTLEKFRDVIFSIDPLWNQSGDNGWNQVFPTKDDLQLQVNTILHTEVVINIGSSMVFDYASHGKPCIFINYDVGDKKLSDWSTDKIYKFVHFRSMPSKNAVVWLNSKEDIPTILKNVINGVPETVTQAEKWFRIINREPAKSASLRIWESIDKITK